jgi:hypothetical protein
LEEKKRFKRGFWGGMQNMVETIGYHVDRGLTKTSETFTEKGEWDLDQTAKYLAENFPRLAGETIWDSALYCRTLTGSLSAFGVAIVTTNYLCYDGYASKTERLQFHIPLRMIRSIQKAVALSPSAPRVAPTIQTIGQGQVGDAIQIFTSDNKVHVFYSFSREKSIPAFFNIIDHAWRAATGQVVAPQPLAPPLMPTVGLTTGPPQGGATFYPSAATVPVTPASTAAPGAYQMVQPAMASTSIYQPHVVKLTPVGPAVPGMGATPYQAAGTAATQPV